MTEIIEKQAISCPKCHYAVFKDTECLHCAEERIKKEYIHGRTRCADKDCRVHRKGCWAPERVRERIPTLGVTRERIRQIEVKAQEKIDQNISQLKS